MAKPQQPELRRSGRTAGLDPDSIGSDLEAGRPDRPEGPGGPVPEANRPGHHPEHEQDKPDGEAFLAKAREHAAEVAAEDTGEEPSERAERLARLAGTPFRVAERALREVEKRL